MRLQKFVHLGANCKNFEMREVCKRINLLKTTYRKINWALPTPSQGGKELFLRLEGRLALHLAGGILENSGMCIHPHFNCPYLPGSGVKGVARHAAWLRWKESGSLEDALNVAWVFGFPTGDRKGLDEFLAKEKPEWFGKDGKYATFAGTISFFPAFPVEGDFEAVVDIVTCHHPKYYTGKNDRPTEDESPNPQFFPVIEKGSLFRFLLAPVRTLNGGELPDQGRLITLAESFLKEGFTLLGAGAKTAAGYGWFAEDRDAAESAEAKREKEAQEQAEQERLNSLSPEDRAAAEIAKAPDFGTRINEIIASGSDLEKRALILLLKGAQSAYWKDLKKRAKKKPKVKKRTEAIQQMASELGEELP
jgi:CRISPR type III-B/RAMP module RAMP protein Cmr6